MRKNKWLAALLALLLLLAGCQTGEPPDSGAGDGEDLPPDTEPVVCMYLTVTTGNAAEDTDHTWAEVNAQPRSWYDAQGIVPYSVAGMLQVGDEDGPTEGSYGYDSVTPNATVRIRGGNSSRHVQKSYRISLKSGKGDWNGQEVINLNKHVSDGLRFRNKLAYDLMAGIPDMLSCTTTFVHLYVKDMTEGGSGEFEDYGLYTQVEHVNKDYLGNHGLDRSGYLYKVNYFDFALHDAIRLATDAAYDDAAFQQYLEVRGEVDNTRLLQMLQDVNDVSIPIRDTVERWFDEDNLLNWLAFHILMGDVDAANENYLLYSPQNEETFYFISWDNDGILKEAEDEAVKGASDVPPWRYGVGNYWDNVLVRRMLLEEHYRDALTEAVETLREDYLTGEAIDELTARYVDAIKPYLYQEPDMIYERLSAGEYDTIANTLANEISTNYQRYKTSLEAPMPFDVHAPAAEAGQFLYSWDEALDLAGDAVSYSFQLARDFTFAEPIAQQEGLRETQLALEALPAGQYFLRVTARDAGGHTQAATDYYVTDGGQVQGVMCFYVLADGSVVEDVYEG